MRQFRGHPPGQEYFSDSEEEVDNDFDEIEPVFYPGMDLQDDVPNGLVFRLLGFDDDDDDEETDDETEDGEESEVSLNDSDYHPDSESEAEAMSEGENTNVTHSSPLSPSQSLGESQGCEATAASTSADYNASAGFSFRAPSCTILYLLMEASTVDLYNLPNKKHHVLKFQWTSSVPTALSDRIQEKSTDQAFVTEFSKYFTQVKNGKLLDCRTNSHSSSLSYVSTLVNVIEKMYIYPEPESSDDSESYFQEKVNIVISSTDSAKMSGLACKVREISCSVTSLSECSTDYVFELTSLCNEAEKSLSPLPVGSFSYSSPPSSTSAVCHSDGSSRNIESLADLEAPTEDLPNETDEVTFCNPMVSDDDEDIDEEAFRGDRIGSTMYCERHVIKLLMELTKTTVSCMERLLEKNVLNKTKKDENEQDDENMGSISESHSNSNPDSRIALEVSNEDYEEMAAAPLDADVDENMCLLWDMSGETDVILFLEKQNIFRIVETTLDANCNYRLSEIALGILANLFSQTPIMEKFMNSEFAQSLQDHLISLTCECKCPSVLIQVFCVYRRIFWYLTNVETRREWMQYFLPSSDYPFLTQVNFILSSSVNVELLRTVIDVLHGLVTVVESPLPVLGEMEIETDTSMYTQWRLAVALNITLVPSICEAVNEILEKEGFYTVPHETRVVIEAAIEIILKLVEFEDVNVLPNPSAKANRGSEVNKTAIQTLLRVMREFYVEQKVDFENFSSKSKIIDEFSNLVSALQAFHSDEGKFFKDAITIPLQAVKALLNYFELVDTTEELDIYVSDSGNNKSEKRLVKGNIILYLVSVSTVYLESCSFSYKDMVDKAIDTAGEDLRKFYVELLEKKKTLLCDSTNNGNEVKEEA